MSVRPSVGPSHVIFRKTKIVDFDDENSSNEIINNATMSDDEVVASYKPPRSLLCSPFLQAVHASTKVDDTIRYLSLHDNKYIRYFPGHTKKVTTLCMSPGIKTISGWSWFNMIFRRVSHIRLHFLRLFQWMTPFWAGVLTRRFDCGIYDPTVAKELWICPPDRCVALDID